MEADRQTDGEMALFGWICHKRTLHRTTRFSRSMALPLRYPGYCQSKTRPSKACSLRKATALLTNVWRVLALFAMSENFWDPNLQPPTASRVFRSGFLWRRPLSSL